MDVNQHIEELFDLYKEFYPSTAESDIYFMNQEIRRLERAARIGWRGGKGKNTQHLLEEGSKRRVME